MIDLTKTYRTRDGREVTNLCSGFDWPYTLRADVGDRTYSYTGVGNYWDDGDENPKDLILVEDQPEATSDQAPAFDPYNADRDSMNRATALNHAVHLPGAHSAAQIVKDAEAFYGFLTGAAAA